MEEGYGEILIYRITPFLKSDAVESQFWFLAILYLQAILWLF